MKKRKPTTWIGINYNHLEFNLRQIAKRVKRKNAGILFVVKAEAYGHGMIGVAKRALRVRSVVYFGVSNGIEAGQLRAAGIRKPILLLGVARPDDIPTLIRQNITLTVSSHEDLQNIAAAAKRICRKAKVHVEVDTGMGRLGVAYPLALALLFECKQHPMIELEGVYTHFPCADDKTKKAYCLKQLEIFGTITKLFSEIHPRALKYVHAANSAGLMGFDDAHFNLVRPGILTYGVDPGCDGLAFKPRPVLSFHSRVTLVKSVEKGTTVSYAHMYTTPKRTQIVVIPVGYSYGYPIRLSNKSQVLIGGKPYPVVGRVTMDQLMVDVGAQAKIKPWDPVVLIGRQGKSEIRVEEIARMAGTIPYEILCGLSQRVLRLSLV